MSNETLTKSIEVLADGKIKAITTKDDAVVFLQPVIVVDSKAATERVEVKGSDKNQVRASVDITSIDGTPFAGDFAALEVALREAAKKANGLRVGGVSDGGTGNASIAKQDEQIVIADDIKNLTSSISTSTAETNEKLEAKKFGYILDIQGQGDPPPYEDITDFTQEINGVSISYLTVAAKAATTKELAQLFNTLQTDIYYAALSETELYFIPVSSDFAAIDSISFEDGSAGALTFSTFGETSDTQTGALHQLVPLAQIQSQRINQLTKATPLLTPAISRSYDGSAVKNLTIDADNNGNTVPIGSFANITIFATNNDVEYRLDGGVVFAPAKSNPRTKKDNTTLLENVNLDIFSIKGAAGNSKYSLVINIYKK